MNLPDGFEIELLAYAGSFLGVLLIYEGLRQVISRSESGAEARNRRMRMIAKGAMPEDVLRLLKPRAEGWSLNRLPFFGNLPTELRHAGWSVSPAQFMLASLSATAALSAAGSLFAPPAMVIALALVLCVIVPVAVLRGIGGKRMDLLTRQLPDALDLMARGLRIGHPLNTTIASVARDMADPVASEFGVMVDQVSYGDDLVDAFMDFADRVDTEDARFLAVSVAIQHGTGGDLAEVLSTLSRVIRARITMRKKIKAISAEGRLSALILSAIPVLIIVMMTILVPGYYGDITGDPAFKPVAAIIFLLIVANAVAMQKLVNFRF